MRPCLKETYQQNHDKHTQANVYTKTQRTELAQTSLQREEPRAGLGCGSVIEHLLHRPRQTSASRLRGTKEKEAERMQEPEDGEEV